MVPSLLKEMIWDTDELMLGERLLRESSGSAPNTGTSVPMELGCLTLPQCGYVPQLGSFLNLTLLGGDSAHKPHNTANLLSRLRVGLTPLTLQFPGL